MKILLVAINAKYIHSNLAVYCLKSYAAKRGIEVELTEYTINHRRDDILMDIYQRKPDVVAFSCYIWNLEFVQDIAADLYKVLPDLEIWEANRRFPMMQRNFWRSIRNFAAL